MAAHPAEMPPGCAICGAPSTSHFECPHEGQRLQLALQQAEERWEERQRIRDWVLENAKQSVMDTFVRLRSARYEMHVAYLQTLPCYTLFQRYNGNPPLPYAQLSVLHNQIKHAQEAYRLGLDEDWRNCCMRYPETLDYYFNLVEVNYPDDGDSVMRSPRIGVPSKEIRRIKQRRGSRGSIEQSNGYRKKDRRRSRGRTPPPAPSVPDGWGRR